MLKPRLMIPVLALGLIGSAGYAQRKPGTKPAKPAGKPVPVVAQEEVTLGGMSNGKMSKQRFLIEMMKPLQAANGRVDGFTFMYGERSMFEDSAGNPLPVTDYLTQYCYGDTLPAIIVSTLQQRIKGGDTAYYSGIKVLKADGTQSSGTPMKLTITP